MAPNSRPMPTYHRTGVVGMGRAFRELFLARMVGTLLKHLTITVKPIEIIAILSLGVPVQLVDQTDIACVLVREPHIRPTANREIPDRFSLEMKVKVALEALFMTFGFSSAWKFIELASANGRYANRLDSGGSHPELRPEIVKLLLDIFSDGCFYEFGLANIQICREIGISPLSAKIIDLEHFFSANDSTWTSGFRLTTSR